jgi:hypothetical protein
MNVGKGVWFLNVLTRFCVTAARKYYSATYHAWDCFSNQLGNGSFYNNTTATRYYFALVQLMLPLREKSYQGFSDFILPLGKTDKHFIGQRTKNDRNAEICFFQVEHHNN